LQAACASVEPSSEKRKKESLPFFNCLPRGNWSLPGKSFPVKRNYELLEARVSHAIPREVKFAFQASV